MRSNLIVLTAQKAQRERRRITLLSIAEEIGVNKNTLYRMANDRISEYPKEVMEKLCQYFSCTLDDLFSLEEEAQGAPAQ